jgi:hypothetical protein
LPVDEPLLLSDMPLQFGNVLLRLREVFSLRARGDPSLPLAIEQMRFPAELSGAIVHPRR